MLLLNVNCIESTDFLHFLLLTAVNMYKHRDKVVIKSLHGSAVTQVVLDGQTIILRLSISYSVL